MSVLVLRVSCLTLFNLQGARLRASQSPVSAQLLYHIDSGLSRTFYKFFSPRPAVRAVSSDSFAIITPFSPKVKNFSVLFQKFFHGFRPFGGIPSVQLHEGASRRRREAGEAL